MYQQFLLLRVKMLFLSFAWRLLNDQPHSAFASSFIRELDINVTKLEKNSACYLLVQAFM